MRGFITLATVLLSLSLSLSLPGVMAAPRPSANSAIQADHGSEARSTILPLKPRSQASRILGTMDKSETAAGENGTGNTLRTRAKELSEKEYPHDYAKMKEIYTALFHEQLFPSFNYAIMKDIYLKFFPLYGKDHDEKETMEFKNLTKAFMAYKNAVKEQQFKLLDLPKGTAEKPQAVPKKPEEEDLPEDFTAILDQQQSEIPEDLRPENGEPVKYLNLEREWLREHTRPYNNRLIGHANTELQEAKLLGIEDNRRPGDEHLKPEELEDERFWTFVHAVEETGDLFR